MKKNKLTDQITQTQQNPQNQVVKAAGLLMAISILARLAGFVREQAIAAKFGTGMETDAYVMAYTVTNIIYLIIGGALATVFIPVFASYLNPPAGGGASSGCSTSGNGGTVALYNSVPQPGQRESAWALASTVINLVVLVLGVITVLGIIGAPWLVKMIAPGFKGAAYQLTTQLTQIMFPITILMALSMLVGVTLNSLQHFAVPALGSVVFSLTVMASVFTLGSIWGIAGLAAGTVVATLLQAAVQVPVLKRKGMRYFPKLQLNHPGLRQIGVLMVPVILGNTVAQAYVFIERILASSLIEGSVSALNFANKLTMLPFNLFALAINVAIFPTMSAHAANKDLAALKKTTLTGLKLVALLTIPAMVWLIVLAEPIVRLVFERGAFDLRSTTMTTQALNFYVLGLFALGAFNVLNRAFYALHDTKTPVFISIFSAGANLGLSLVLVRYLQHAGLALASALASNLNFLLTYFFIRFRLPNYRERDLWLPLGKIVLASVITGLGIWGSAQLVASMLGAGGAGGAVGVTGAGGSLGAAVGAAIAGTGSGGVSAVGIIGGVDTGIAGTAGALGTAGAAGAGVAGALGTAGMVSVSGLLNLLLVVGIPSLVGAAIYLFLIWKLKPDAELLELIGKTLRQTGAKLGIKMSK